MASSSSSPFSDHLSPRRNGDNTMSSRTKERNRYRHNEIRLKNENRKFSHECNENNEVILSPGRALSSLTRDCQKKKSIHSVCTSPNDENYYYSPSNHSKIPSFPDDEETLVSLDPEKALESMTTRLNSHYRSDQRNDNNKIQPKDNASRDHCNNDQEIAKQEGVPKESEQSFQTLKIAESEPMAHLHSNQINEACDASLEHVFNASTKFKGNYDVSFSAVSLSCSGSGSGSKCGSSESSSNGKIKIHLSVREKEKRQSKSMSSSVISSCTDNSNSLFQFTGRLRRRQKFKTDDSSLSSQEEPLQSLQERTQYAYLRRRMSDSFAKKIANTATEKMSMKSIQTKKAMLAAKTVKKEMKKEGGVNTGKTEVGKEKAIGNAIKQKETAETVKQMSIVSPPPTYSRRNSDNYVSNTCKDNEILSSSKVISLSPVVAPTAESSSKEILLSPPSTKKVVFLRDRDKGDDDALSSVMTGFDSVKSTYTKSVESEVEDALKDLFFIGSEKRSKPGRRERRVNNRVESIHRQYQFDYFDDSCSILDEETTILSLMSNSVDSQNERNTRGKTAQEGSYIFSPTRDSLASMSTDFLSSSPSVTFSSLTTQQEDDGKIIPETFLRGVSAVLSEAFGMNNHECDDDEDESEDSESVAIFKNNRNFSLSGAITYATDMILRPAVAEATDILLGPPNKTKRALPQSSSVNKTKSRSKNSGVIKKKKVVNKSSKRQKHTVHRPLGNAMDPMDKIKYDNFQDILLEDDPRLADFALNTARAIHTFHGLKLEEHSNTKDFVTEFDFKIVQIAMPFGILLEENCGGCWVAQVFQDGNAANCILVGDQLAAINGHSAIKMTTEEFSRYLSEMKKKEEEQGNAEALFELTLLRYIGELHPTKIEDATIQPSDARIIIDSEIGKENIYQGENTKASETLENKRKKGKIPKVKKWFQRSKKNEAEIVGNDDCECI